MNDATGTSGVFRRRCGCPLAVSEQARRAASTDRVHAARAMHRLMMRRDGRRQLEDGGADRYVPCVASRFSRALTACALRAFSAQDERGTSRKLILYGTLRSSLYVNFCATNSYKKQVMISKNCI